MFHGNWLIKFLPFYCSEPYSSMRHPSVVKKTPEIFFYVAPLFVLRKTPEIFFYVATFWSLNSLFIAWDVPNPKSPIAVSFSNSYKWSRVFPFWLHVLLWARSNLANGTTIVGLHMKQMLLNKGVKHQGLSQVEVQIVLKSSHSFKAQMNR